MIVQVCAISRKERVYNGCGLYGAFRWGHVYCVYEESPYECPSLVVFMKWKFSESLEFTRCDVYFILVFRNGRGHGSSFFPWMVS